MTPFRAARLLAGLFVCLPLLSFAGASEPTPAVNKACEQVGGRLRSVGAKNCQKMKLLDSGQTSVRGVPLLYRDFEPGSKAEDPADGKAPKRVLMIGGIHGDELTSVSIAFRWMQTLEKENRQPFVWRVIPYSNPDGLLAKPSTRTNAHGVDLNRNFLTDDWEGNAISYWKEKTKSDKRRYPGKKPLSEPESRWLTDQIRQFKPDAIVSIHAPYGVLDFDGPREPPKKFGYLRLQLLGTYPGSLGNYAGANLNVPVVTLELRHAGIMPTTEQTEQIWGDMLHWLEVNLPKPLRSDAGGTVAQAKSSASNEAPEAPLSR